MRLGDMIASALALLPLTCLVGGIFLVFGRPLWRERSGQMGIVAKSPRHGGTDDAGRPVFAHQPTRDAKQRRPTQHLNHSMRPMFRPVADMHQPKRVLLGRLT